MDRAHNYEDGLQNVYLIKWRLHVVLSPAVKILVVL